MSRRDWIDLGGFLSVVSIVAGAVVAHLIEGMEPAVFVGTLPGIAYCIAMHFHDWSREI